MCDAVYKDIQHHFKILLQIDLPDDLGTYLCTFEVQFIFLLLLFQTLIMVDTEFLSFPYQNPRLPSKTV
jgi:hypothetical protein